MKRSKRKMNSIPSKKFKLNSNKNVSMQKVYQFPSISDQKKKKYRIINIVVLFYNDCS